MKVRVKLYASLSDYLPDGVLPHQGVVLELPPEITPHALLDRLSVPRRAAKLMLRNGVFIPPEERELSILDEGDVIAVWPPVAGG